MTRNRTFRWITVVGSLVALCFVVATVSRRVKAKPQGSRRPARFAQIRAANLGMEKIEHVVFIIKENRTFDNYFGTFPGADGATSGTISTGDVIQLGHTPDRTPRDISHAWNAAITAIDGGAMDQFDLIPGGNQNGELSCLHPTYRKRHPELFCPGTLFHSGRCDVFVLNGTKLSKSPLHCRCTIWRRNQ